MRITIETSVGAPLAAATATPSPTRSSTSQSQRSDHLAVLGDMVRRAYRTRTSWGYYNNHTKQDVPADWSVTRGEDTYFAHRMARGIGIPVEPPPPEEHYYFQGFEPHMIQDGKRWVRVAALYPEKVDHVEYYRNAELMDLAYDEPFYPGYVTTWIQTPIVIRPEDKTFVARIVQADGDVIEKTVEL